MTRGRRPRPLAEDHDPRASGFADAQTPFADQHRVWSERVIMEDAPNAYLAQPVPTLEQRKADLRTLQRAWPQTRFTWLIGRAEARLLAPLLPEVEFITVDKRAGLRGLRELRRTLGNRRFDLLLHLQLSIRARAVAAVIRARCKLGFCEGLYEQVPLS